MAVIDSHWVVHSVYWTLYFCFRVSVYVLFPEFVDCMKNIQCLGHQVCLNTHYDVLTAEWLLHAFLRAHPCH